MFPDIYAVPILFEVINDFFDVRKSKWSEWITVDIVFSLQLHPLANELGVGQNYKIVKQEDGCQVGDIDDNIYELKVL